LNLQDAAITAQKYFFYLVFRAKQLHPYNLSPVYRRRARMIIGETLKSRKRRLREGFFEKYCQGKGIDIGCGPYDRIMPDVDGWDKEDGDAALMAGIPDETYDYAYSSHCLEHIIDQSRALQNWLRILKKGGFLIISVPHRDLYEKKERLPSQWNKDHKRFYLPDKDSPPDTVSFRRVVEEAIGKEAEWIYLKICKEGWVPLPDHVHPRGEYQIEAVLRKSES